METAPPDIITRMNFQVAGHQTEGYRVFTPVYEGPLDLLLDLIERAELDITSLALAQVTDQFLSYLGSMEIHTPGEVSAFLLIASRLIQIKSQALLPRPPVVEPGFVEEDSGEALARQLIIYKRFKEIGAHLEFRQESNLRTFLRLSAAPHRFDTKLDLDGISLKDLLLAAQEILAANPNLTNLEQVVNMPRITIREKITAILNQLRNNDSTSFRNILLNDDRVEIVVTFLAILELIKRQIVQAQQSSLFGDIQLQTLESPGEGEITDVEFSE